MRHHMQVHPGQVGQLMLAKVILLLRMRPIDLVDAVAHVAVHVLQGRDHKPIVVGSPPVIQTVSILTVQVRRDGTIPFAGGVSAFAGRPPLLLHVHILRPKPANSKLQERAVLMPCPTA